MTASEKKVVVVGGTGFLGYHAIIEFIRAGWQVTAVGLPPRNASDIQPYLEEMQDIFPSSVRIVLLDMEKASDEMIQDVMSSHTGLVYAAGLDDRFTPREPAYPVFHHHNVEVPGRILTLGKNVGVKRVVVLGSYFAYFDRLWPEMKLKERHPYIRSRVQQELLVTGIQGVDGMVLELPYIFGSLPIPGWRPLWNPLIQYIRSSRVLPYMKGGSACVSAATVGKAIAAAMERGMGGVCYPIGQINLSWNDLLKNLALVEGRRVYILSIPRAIIHLGMLAVFLYHKFQGRESGLNLRYFSSLQTSDAFIDPMISKKALLYEEGDIKEAFRQTVQACDLKK